MTSSPGDVGTLYKEFACQLPATSTAVFQRLRHNRKRGHSSMFEPHLRDVNRSRYSYFCHRLLPYGRKVVISANWLRRGPLKLILSGGLLTYLAERGLWRAVLLTMLVALAFIAFWPSPVDEPVQGQLDKALQFLHAHGIPRWFNYYFVEASANVALYVPVGFVSALAFPARRWWQIGIFGLILSGCVELGQLMFLHNRFASSQDLVTNASGAVMGALLAAGALRRLRARSLPAGGP